MMSDAEPGKSVIKGSSDVPVVLGSGSRLRAAMLRDAGVDFEVLTAGVDEAAVRESLAAEGASAADAAIALAELKAIAVSRKRPEAFVIGADQMLDCNGIWFEKPVDRAHAEATLRALAGRPHRLISAVVVARAGSRIWYASEDVTMTMRPLSDEFIAEYLDVCGDRVMETVGAYELEGLGGQLFSSVAGDYFTVLGLPLLPLLDFLRTHDVLKR